MPFKKTFWNLLRGTFNRRPHADKQLVRHTPKGYAVSDLFFAMWINKQ